MSDNVTGINEGDSVTGIEAQDLVDQIKTDEAIEDLKATLVEQVKEELADLPDDQVIGKVVMTFAQIGMAIGMDPQTTFNAAGKALTDIGFHR